MHWFWRATIATSAGLVPCLVIVKLSPNGPRFFSTVIAYAGRGVAFWMFFGLSATVTAFAAYGVLTNLFRGEISDRETRCRNCGYILRGITEPRCPECGERI